MVVHFLYCIDFPGKSDKVEKSDQVRGWLLCSDKITGIRTSDPSDNKYFLEYGLPRPDVALHFKDFPGNDQCGFTIIAGKEPLILNNEFVLEVEVDTSPDKPKNIKIPLDLASSSIQEIEVDDDKQQSYSIAEKTEQKFIRTLQKHPWITVRMDITNKCNLRCIMCHYKEKEIYSQPVKNVTASQLKYYLQDIAPYVKHIMLSCGFEPLMSKHFAEIAGMLHENFPHMEIGLCTNGMLMNSKARKVFIENRITHVLLSLDGVTKKTVERIRVGSDFGRIISNIMALRDLKLKYKRNFPLLIMDFVMMNSNIHEAPAFVNLCSELGIDMIDFRHMVGNIYYSDHDEMLTNHKERYNYYRRIIIDESKKFNINVRLPEAFNNAGTYMPEDIPQVDLSDFSDVRPDVQTEEINDIGEIFFDNGDDNDFAFLSSASCLRPFNEIMIVDQEQLRPCAYYNGSMGKLDENNTLYSIFFNEKFRKVRRKKMLSLFDHNCLNCPIKSNLLPTDIVR